MKKTSFFPAFILLISLFSCIKKEAPPELGAENVAGFLNTQVGILFTTATDQADVLAKLEAKPAEEGMFAMPIMEHEGKTVWYTFQVSQVEKPWEYLGYVIEDICMDQVFFDFESQVDDLIEGAVPNLGDQIVMACGDLVGDLEEEVKEKTPEERLKEQQEKLREFSERLLEMGRELGRAAEEALKQQDADAAKEKGKELAKNAKREFSLDLDYCLDKDWNFGFGWRYGYEFQEELPPELIQEFSKNFVRYKVYKEATCGVGPPTMARNCSMELPLMLPGDSLSKPIPMPTRWVTDEYYERKVCRIGKGFCVEQEVVIGLSKVYSDPNCTRMIHVRSFKGFSCFDS